MLLMRFILIYERSWEYIRHILGPGDCRPKFNREENCFSQIIKLNGAKYNH